MKEEEVDAEWDYVAETSDAVRFDMLERGLVGENFLGADTAFSGKSPDEIG